MSKPLTKKEWEVSVAKAWGAAIESTYEDLLREARADAIESMIPHLVDLWEEQPTAIMFDDMRRYAASIRASK